MHNHLGAMHIVRHHHFEIFDPSALSPTEITYFVHDSLHPKGNIFRTFLFTPKHFPKLYFFWILALYLIIVMCHLIKDAKNHALHAYGWVSKPALLLLWRLYPVGIDSICIPLLLWIRRKYVVTTYQGHPTYFLAKRSQQHIDIYALHT